MFTLHKSHADLTQPVFNKKITYVMYFDESVRGIPTNRIALYPWKRSTQIDYHVAVHVNRFDVMPDGDASLIARWTISGSDDNGSLLERKTTFSTPVNAQSFEARVAAMSRLIEDLSKEIAAAINTMSRENLAKNHFVALTRNDACAT